MMGNMCCGGTWITVFVACQARAAEHTCMPPAVGGGKPPPAPPPYNLKKQKKHDPQYHPQGKHVVSLSSLSMLCCLCICWVAYLLCWLIICGGGTTPSARDIQIGVGEEGGVGEGEGGPPGGGEGAVDGGEVGVQGGVRGCVVVWVVGGVRERVPGGGCPGGVGLLCCMDLLYT